MAKKRADRIRRRVTCELQLDGRSYRGIVLDLSETGVFVQTEATPPPGTRVRLRLHTAGGVEFVVEATVARRQVAPPQLASVVRGGLGLRVEDPPTAYFKLIGMEAAAGTGRTLGGPDAPAPGAGPAGAPPPGASGAFGTVGSAGPSRAAPRAPAPAAAPSPPPPDTRPEFRVRVKQSDGPRSRTLKVKAGSPSEARRNALAELGKGWEILSVEAA
jgi:hypothetical protein